MEDQGYLNPDGSDEVGAYSNPFDQSSLMMYRPGSLARMVQGMIPGTEGAATVTEGERDAAQMADVISPNPEEMAASIDSQMHTIEYLEGTLAHFRSWMEQLQNRHQMAHPDATRPAKRIYIGNLPATAHEAALRHFVNNLMIQVRGCAGPGFPIISCKLYSTHPVPGDGSLSNIQLTNYNTERTYAFLELRSIEEASNLMALDGVHFQSSPLKIRRPNNYDASLAVMLGPVEANPAMTLSRMGIVRTMVQDSVHKVFIGGLPFEWTEDQVQELLLPFGRLQAFNLVKDRVTGNSKGYAFCEFVDPMGTEAAIQGLNGKAVGNKFLTVKRALSPGSF